MPRETSTFNDMHDGYTVIAHLACSTGKHVSSGSVQVLGTLSGESSGSDTGEVGLLGAMREKPLE